MMNDYYVISAVERRGSDLSRVFAHIDKTFGNNNAMWVLRAEDAERFQTLSEAENFFTNHREELVKDNMQLYVVEKVCSVYAKSLFV